RLVMVLPVERFRDLESLPVELLRLRIIAELLLDGAEIDQVLRHQRMAVAVQLPMHSQQTPVQRVRFGIVPRIEVAGRQLEETVRKVRWIAAGRGTESPRFFEGL